MRRLFLSYSHRDSTFVDQLNNDLSREGVVVWIDRYQIDAGDSIVWRISMSLAAHDYFAAVLSPDYLSSKWCRRELSACINAAIQREAAILPIFHRDCEIPAILGDIAFADFRHSYADGLSQLLRALHRARRIKKPLPNDQRVVIGNFTWEHNASSGIDVLSARGKEEHYPVTFALKDWSRTEPSEGDFSFEFDLTNNTSTEIRILGVEVEVVNWRPLEKVLRIVPYAGLGERRLFFGVFRSAVGKYPCYFSVPNGYVKLGPRELEVFRVQANTPDEGIYDLRIRVRCSEAGKDLTLTSQAVGGLHFVGEATRSREQARRVLQRL